MNANSFHCWCWSTYLYEIHLKKMTLPLFWNDLSSFPGLDTQNVCLGRECHNPAAHRSGETWSLNLTLNSQLLCPLLEKNSYREHCLVKSLWTVIAYHCHVDTCVAMNQYLCDMELLICPLEWLLSKLSPNNLIVFPKIDLPSISIYMRLIVYINQHKWIICHLVTSDDKIQSCMEIMFDTFSIW